MNRTEFTQKFNTQYEWLMKNNLALLDKVFPRKLIYWTLETCKAEALKYKTRKEWIKQRASSYQAALRNKWLEECTKHMSILHTNWTLELCKEAALKYASRKEWEKQHPSSYQAAYRNKWLDECVKHMSYIYIKWTLELCMQEALKYKSRKEWSIKNTNSYQAARHNKWSEECTKHMSPPLSGKKYVKNLDTKKVYESIAQAGKSINQTAASITSCCRGKRKTAGGYRWVYCDEQGNVLND